MRFCWLLVFFLVLPLLGQNKHSFTFEDMMALKRVAEPVVSPDGNWVLFAAVDVDLKANTKTPHVWAVPLNGTAVAPTAQEDSRKNPSASLGVANVEREIISDQDADRPRWAPDGKRFAFVSTKENGSQIWIADFDPATGKVRTKQRLTNVPTEADGESWSPEGSYMLFKSDVYPECAGTPAEETICNSRKVAEAKNSKVRAQLFTHLLYRHWNAYKQEKRTHVFVQHFPQPGEGGGAQPGLGGPTVARDLTPGDYDAPVFSLGGQDNYALSPDGKELCYASNHDTMPAASTNNDLFTVPVDWPANASSAQVLAATKNITAENKAADNTPLYSPDGKYIAYRAQQRPGYESDRWRLMLHDRKTGKKTNMTEDFDRWVGSFGWAGHFEIFLTAENDGDSPIYSIWPDLCPEGCRPVELVDGYNDDVSSMMTHTVTERGGSFNEILVFSRMSLQAPAQIFTVEHPDCVVGMEKLKSLLLGKSKEPLPDCALAKARQLSHLNDDVLRKVSMSPLESFWFMGANKDKVQGFLIKPPGFDPDKKYPVKFLIHGGPEGAWGDDWSYRWNPELFAANGYVVIMINFHGSTGYGQKFIDAINGDWGGAPFEDLMKGLDYAEQRYPFIDKDRECALGASYGGYMANWILGHSNRFKCIVSHDGLFNTESAYGDTEELWFPEWEFQGTPWTNRQVYQKWSPHLSAPNFKTPTLVVHGQLDYRLDVSQGFDLFTTLQRQGVPSQMLYFPDEGHWVLKPQNSLLWYDTVNRWVDQWVGNAAASGRLVSGHCGGPAKHLKLAFGELVRCACDPKCVCCKSLDLSITIGFILSSC
jgi:dipeptidyl aminopeptidase/acylaminoacyl peptidase